MAIHLDRRSDPDSAMSTRPEQLYLRRGHVMDPAMVVRHKARYLFAGGLCRHGEHVLDAPCGSGYGAKLLAPLRLHYVGLDRSEEAIAYARLHYKEYGLFRCAHLDAPTLRLRLPQTPGYDVILCIEGLEHLSAETQPQVLADFVEALNPGGRLVITSPLHLGDTSGPNPKNPHHLHELTRADFEILLLKHFPREHIEIVSMRDVLDTGEEQTCLYAVCHHRP